MEAVIKLIRKCMERGLPLPPIFFKLAGYQQIRQWRFDEAADFFSYLRKKFPERLDGYEGLILLARKTQEPDLMFQRLADALEQFPGNLEYSQLYIKSLTARGNRAEAQQFIRKNATRFQNSPDWALVEATFWSEQYDYQAAQSILDEAIEKHSEHPKLRLMQAYNLWQKGDSQRAKIILENIHPELDYEKKYLPVHFTIPYIAILLDNNETEKLSRFFKKAIAFEIQNWEVVSGYIQLLISDENYRVATTAVKEMIARKDNQLYLNYFALLFFDLEKIKDIQSFAESKQMPLERNRDLHALPEFLPKLITHLEQHPKFIKEGNLVLDIFHQMSQLSKTKQVWLNTYISLKENYRIAQLIIEQIKMKQPFSLIRLGDGEGHFLPYESNLNSFKQDDQASSQRIWWGEEKIDEKDWEQLESDYLVAIKNADLLGIPGLWRCCKTILNISSPNSKLSTEARGLKSIFDFLGSYSSNNEHNQILTSSHIHTQLEELGLWDLILQEIESCAVISCHPALEKLLLEKHRITVRAFYSIPSEYKYSKLFQHEQEELPPHFPDRFEQIRAEISVAYRGEVFLVAAGFLGKFYCQIIKEKGGIALDIGSAADYWLDYQTRFWTKYPSPINFGKKRVYDP